MSEWDTSQVDRLAADLSEAPGRIQRSAPKVFEVGANKIKKNMKRLASGHGHLPKFASHVSYDKLGPLDYEIGFDRVGQGNLANIANYGSVNNAPVMDHTLALRMEIPSIMRELGDKAEGAVLGDESGSAPSSKIRYTTNSGKVRMASVAQVNHWTRNY